MLLHKHFLCGEVADRVLDKRRQDCIDNGLGGVVPDSVFQFGKGAKKLLVLPIKLSDIDAVTGIPMKRVVHESPILLIKLVV
jgi:hypothetical protein